MKMLLEAAINPQKKNTNANEARALPFVLIFGASGWFITIVK
jgi:hypothetical protein